MAFCPNCGTQVSGRFCPNCGTDMGAAAGAGGTSGGPTGTGPASAGAPWTPPPGAVPVASAGLTDNVASALCYLAGFITGIIFLILAPYNRNPTVRFHAFQSIFLCVAVFVVDVGLNIIFAILHMWVVGFAIMRLVSLGWFVLWLYMMFTAYNGRTLRLPVIGDLAAKQA